MPADGPPAFAMLRRAKQGRGYSNFLSTSITIAALEQQALKNRGPYFFNERT